LVDGKNSIDQIIASLKIKFKDVEGIEKDILSMIQFALDKAWIEKAN
jgi:pyrroloquinoline quinone biosynthesis protein D